MLWAEPVPANQMKILSVTETNLKINFLILFLFFSSFTSDLFERFVNSWIGNRI